MLLIPLLLQYLKYICFEEYYLLIEKLNSILIIYDVLKLYDDNKEELLLIQVPNYLDIMINYHLNEENNPYKDEIDISDNYFKNRSTEEQFLYPKMNVALTHYINVLLWLEKNHVILYFLKNMENNYDNKLNLLIYICYFIGWFYIMVNIMSQLFPEYFLFIPIWEDPFSSVHTEDDNENIAKFN